jgi:hypothetical protein
MNASTVTFDEANLKRMLKEAGRTFEGEVPLFALTVFGEAFIRERVATTRDNIRIAVHAVRTTTLRRVLANVKYQVQYFVMPKQRKGDYAVTIELFRVFDSPTMEDQVITAIIQLDYSVAEAE